MVTFESGGSLLRMIACGRVDLDFSFEIYVCALDGVMNFPGYSVSILSHVANSVRLVKSD
jgi:hypothetical protein